MAIHNPEEFNTPMSERGWEVGNAKVEKGEMPKPKVFSTDVSSESAGLPSAGHTKSIMDSAAHWVPASDFPSPKSSPILD